MSAVPLSRAAGAVGPRRSLILAGGGMRVAYQAGVLRALAEAGLTFDHADGTSGGTINLAMLFSGVPPADMCERWATLPVREFVSFLPVQEYLRLEGPIALGGAGGIVRGVFPHLGIDLPRINAATGMEATFNVCNFTTKTNRVVSHRDLTLDLLVAGISLPIFMPPVRVDGSDYVDSVWIRDANLAEAVARGAEEIWLVWCIGNAPVYRSGPFHQYVHMIELSANGKLFAELAWLAELNRRIARGDSPYGQRAPVRLKVVKPVHPLPLDPSYYLGRIDGASLVAMGYADACRRLDAAGEDDPLTEVATQMRAPDRPVTFCEQLHGEVRGDVNGPCALSTRVVVQDLPGFLAGSAGAELYGAVTLGEGPPLLLRDGTFRHVAEGGSAPVRRLVSQASVVRAGTRLHVTAERTLRGDRGSDLMHDLARVALVVRAGAAPPAPAAAEGTLTAGLDDLRALASSVHAVEPSTPGEGWDDVLRLGGLLFGDLRDVSLRPERPWWKPWRWGEEGGRAAGG